MADKVNVFDIVPKSSDEEIFTDLLKKDNLQIEKIISYGQVTPIDQPYIQDHNEWVLILKGRAKVKLEDNGYTLEEGEYLYIPKNMKHWVTYTSNPTIWLAIHFKD
ncbi:cupin [Candidatus Francisella endociliophora]|uniref:Cupin n=1 Tax=Candidatus Francisella endociliophora TaxID=653937 RepID=A0A097ER24_9GAMM|nr:cupin domain-containing protein [Francisella sp. FSC1006]AIT10025.1 cupin [Francisella sp. FSC1006]